MRVNSPPRKSDVLEPLKTFQHSLSPALQQRLRAKEPLAPYTSLRVGGAADLYLRAETTEELAEASALAQRLQLPYFLLGGGSNICISDAGIRGIVLHNACTRCDIGTVTHVETGCVFMRLFLKSLRAELSGLEFAVGIPGSVGGALVSNAGAYRQNICDLVAQLDVVEDGRRQEVGPEWMAFSYRDSRLRRADASPATVLSVTLNLTPRPRAAILARARENQRQRIYKQPWYPSAGSFFKNVYDRALAEQLPSLPTAMKEAGVVPAGYLSAACGCKGLTVGGAQISQRHGNFVVNRGHSTATDIRALTGEVKRRVQERFGVALHEEVLYVGDWSE